MRVSRLPAVLIACLCLAGLPAGAAAQSAGDDQYVDPLNGVGETGGGDSSGSGTAGSGPSEGAASGADSGAALPSELARTGAELPLLAGAGLLLLAGGAGLRRFSGGRR